MAFTPIENEEGDRKEALKKKKKSAINPDALGKLASLIKGFGGKGGNGGGSGGASVSSSGRQLGSRRAIPD